MMKWNVKKAIRVAQCAVFGAAMIFVAGCFGSQKHPDFLVPQEDTVEAQFNVAQSQERGARGIYDKAKRQGELEKAVIAYQAVEDRFPDDAKYTPAASLFIANIQQEIEEHEKAIAQYEHVLQTFPDDEEVRLSALLGMGISLDELARPEEAQVYYKMLIDQYQASSDPRVLQMVETARKRYRQIRPR